MWRGTDGEHEDELLGQIYVGPEYGYGGGFEKTFTYGDNTSFIKLHLMGYPFQSNLGLAERIPQEVGMLKNDIGYITMSGAERTFASKSEVSAIDASVIALGSEVSAVGASVSTLTSQVSNLTASLSNYATISYVDSLVGSINSALDAINGSII